MTTPDQKKREELIKDYVETQRAIGGITPSKLSPDQTIMVDTDTFVYRFDVRQTYSGKRFHLDTGNQKCQGKSCIDIRSHCSALKYEMADWIGLGMQLILKFSNGKSFVTGEVTGAQINGKKQDGREYRYEVWD